MPEELTVLALSLPNVGSTLWTILGIGLVIFVHELGHFLCAKKVGVRVEVFSLGFGPRLWGFERGGTDYRLSAVPVGGYVKMAGDQPGEGAGAADELGSRSVAERALIYSGGVIMNVIFALVVFPVIFAIGVPMVKPAVGAVEPGGPAWLAGLERNDEILEINGREVLGFSDVVLETALGDPDDTSFLIRRDGEERVVRIHPKYSERLGTYAIQIEQPTEDAISVMEDGPAAKAGIRNGDRIVGLNGERFSERRFELMAVRPGENVTFSVDRNGELLEFVVEPEWLEESDRPLIGIRAMENLVVGLRGAFSDAGPLQAGDRLVSLSGRPILDQESAEDAVAALAGAGGTATIERHGEIRDVDLSPTLVKRLTEDVALHWDGGDDATASTHPVPIRVAPNTPAAEAGLETGVRVRSIDGEATPTWNAVRKAIADADGDPVSLVVIDADGVEKTVDVAPATSPVANFGLALEYSYVQRKYGLGEAFLVGLHSSWNLTRQAYLTLKKMVSRQVSAENLGGIVAISHVSYRFAELGLAKLFYFLALLSINLAVINLLPIPVLDGGHLLFLLIEKVIGGPVPERFMGYSQVVGMVFILSLLIFVTYNDIMRILT